MYVDALYKLAVYFVCMGVQSYILAVQHTDLSVYTDLIDVYQIYIAVHLVCLFMKRNKENFWCTFPFHCMAHAQGH